VGLITKQKSNFLHEMIRKQAKFPLTFLVPKNPVAPIKPAHDKLVPIKG
jgi:hypothetical protein